MPRSELFDELVRWINVMLGLPPDTPLPDDEIPIIERIARQAEQLLEE